MARARQCLGSAFIALVCAGAWWTASNPHTFCGPARRRAADVKRQAGRARLRMAAKPDDIGYNLLFETAAAEFTDRCATASKPFPAYAKGDFIIPSVGLFEMGDRNFVGFLDAFGKMQRFHIDGDRVCATYRVMETGFYNVSKEAGTIGPGLLFFETVPPREQPWYNPISNMPPFAPNDNTYVNTFRLGKELISVTDSYSMTCIDPKSLKVIGVKEFDDDLQDLVCYTGSAHPLRHPQTRDMIDFVGNSGLFDEAATIRLFALGEKEPKIRRSLADVNMETSPYIHSFGLTDNFAILPRMPVKFSAQSVALEPMASAFKPLELAQGPENAFHVVSLNGSGSIIKALPAEMPLWYVHTVNAFENASGVVIDITTTPQNPFASDLTIAAARDKATRDLGAAGGKNLVKRFLLPLNNEPVTVEILSDPSAATDFPKINPNYHAKEHCFYWAVEWFAGGSDSYASMALVKHDVCSGAEKRTWMRQHWYPTEATMVPSDRDGAAEDEGVLVFVALDGESGQSYLLGVDAATMETISEAGPFPRIAFSTHGEFYPAGSL